MSVMIPIYRAKKIDSDEYIVEYMPISRAKERYVKEET